MQGNLSEIRRIMLLMAIDLVPASFRRQSISAFPLHQKSKRFLRAPSAAEKEGHPEDDKSTITQNKK